MGFLTALFLPPLVGLTAAQTPGIALHLDPAKTQIHGTLTNVRHTVHGTFALNTETVGFDPQTGAAHGEVAAETDSRQSGNGMRDRRIRKEILQTERYPEAKDPNTLFLRVQKHLDVDVGAIWTLEGAGTQSH